jgi:hypothetical protein
MPPMESIPWPVLAGSRVFALNELATISCLSRELARRLEQPGVLRFWRDAAAALGEFPSVELVACRSEAKYRLRSLNRANRILRWSAEWQNKADEACGIKSIDWVADRPVFCWIIETFRPPWGTVVGQHYNGSIIDEFESDEDLEHLIWLDEMYDLGENGGPYLGGDLMWTACWSNAKSAAKWILSKFGHEALHGPNPYANSGNPRMLPIDNDEDTPLSIASHNGHTCLVAWLLHELDSAGELTECRIVEALQAAASGRRIAVSHILTTYWLGRTVDGGGD